MATCPPSGLRSLVESYEGKEQAPVRFRVPSWDRALADSRPGITELLRDDRYTRPCTSERFRCAGDRTTTRAAIRCACEAIDLDDTDQLLRAFALVMALGVRDDERRGLGNCTARAVGAVHETAFWAGLSSSCKSPEAFGFDVRP